MDSKYGSSWGGWRSNAVIGSHGVGLWKNIRRGWGSFLDLLILWWVMVLGLDFGMTFGVEIRPLR
jgi:hypothetical protein